MLTASGVAATRVAMLAELNGALYWFHPLAWFLQRKLSALAEQSCDDAVLEANTGRTEYARYLVEVASSLSRSSVRCHAPLQSVAMARVPSVETRIEAILDSGRPPSRSIAGNNRRLSGTIVLKGEVEGSIKITLQPASTLKGRIINQQGAPIPDVTIHTVSMLILPWIQDKGRGNTPGDQRLILA